MKIVIIDGNSLINRAYYAMQRPMITKSGLYTQGVYGFLNMLNKINTDYSPDYMLVAFDRKAPTFRHLEYEDYKAGRKKMPPELAMQIPLLKDVLDAMKIKILELDGYEADDIIGTVAKESESEGLDTLIISGDKDELQLASDTVKVLITKKGISEFDLYDEAAMLEKYGFTPRQFIDFKGLMGDASDNIPGIPGVGEKTAQKLILEYGSVENLIANTHNIKNQKLKEKIEEHAQLALMSKRLATINCQVPIEINFEEFKVEPPDYDALIEQYRRLEFNSFLKKLRPSGGNQSPGMTNNPENSHTETILGKVKDLSDIKSLLITKDEEFQSLRQDVDRDKAIVLKVFSNNSHKDIPLIYGINIMSNTTSYFVKGESEYLQKVISDVLLCTDVKISGHNLKDDYYALLANGASREVSNKGNNQDASLYRFNTKFDTAIAQYLIDPSRSNYDMKTLMLEYFHEEIASEEDFNAANGQMSLLDNPDETYLNYGIQWCKAVKKLQAILEDMLADEELDSVFQNIELPLIEVLAAMECNGFAVDCQELTDAGSFITEKINELTQKIYALAGEEFNINSPIQMGTILFEKLGMPSGKKTKRGYATGVEILDKLKDDYEIAGLILEYRMYAKLKGTYIDGLLPMIHMDNKIHAHFQQTVTATGRISCTEPNLQNIPIRQEVGRKLRKAFVPENQDFCLVGADYSQIELRILAHLSQDQSLIDAFNKGEDIHKITASKVFGIPENEVTLLQRSNAKAVNFGVIYGMSGFGLSTELNITRKEAEKYIEEYFKKYVKVKEYLDSQVAGCREKGYVTTIMKRKRIVKEINARNYMLRQAGERLAMNSPIQGSAADIIKLAMIKVYNELRKNNTKSRLILQVHDELIIQTHKDELEKVKKLLVDSMENAVQLSVKLSVDLNTGNNWYELK